MYKSPVRYAFFIFYLLVFSSCIAQPKNGPFVTHYPNGGVKDSGNYSKKLKDGVWLQYFENGTLEFKTTYKAGKREGPEFHYEKSGLLQRACWYHNDSLHGMYYFFGGDGKVNSITEYRSGKRNGWSRIYAKRYQPYLRSKTFFRNDSLVLRVEYYPSGRIEKITPYKNNEIDGTTRYYPERRYYEWDTFPIVTSVYKMGIPEGPVITSYSSGKIQKKEYFVKGRKEGRQEYFNESGRLIRVENFSAGKQQGEEVVYEYVDTALTRITWCEYDAGLKNGKEYLIVHGDTIRIQWYSAGLFDSLVHYEFTSAKKLFLYETIHLTKREGIRSEYVRRTYYESGRLQQQFATISSNSLFAGAPTGLFTEYYEDGKKKKEMWVNPVNRERQYANGYESIAPDSFCRTWYPNGRPEVMCKARYGVLSARPDIWNEKGVKLNPSSKEYSAVFCSVVKPALYINPYVYDPTSDHIDWQQETNHIEPMLIEEGWIERNPDSWQPGGDTVYTSVEVPAASGDNPSAIEDMVLYYLSPAVYWFTPMTVDSVCADFVITAYGSPEQIQYTHQAMIEQMNWAVLEAIRATREWRPATNESLRVKSRVSYTLSTEELYAMISGNTYKPGKKRR